MDDCDRICHQLKHKFTPGSHQGTYAGPWSERLMQKKCLRLINFQTVFLCFMENRILMYAILTSLSTKCVDIQYFKYVGCVVGLSKL